MKRLVLGAWCLALGLSSVLVSGCGSSYAWRSSVPEGVRTVSVPTFRNESDVMELGALASRQILREFQREGTFRIASEGDAALEIQGIVKSVKEGINAYDRRTGNNFASYDFTAIAEVSVIDKRMRKVLVDNRRYTARALFTAEQDLATAKRNASGRLMEDLAQQVVDDVLRIDWSSEREGNGKHE